MTSPSAVTRWLAEDMDLGVHQIAVGEPMRQPRLELLAGKPPTRIVPIKGREISPRELTRTWRESFATR